MAYETGTATSLADLLTKFSTFVQANGWTQDEFDNGGAVAGEGRAAWHKNGIYISVKWNATTPTFMSMHQATGYTGGQHPGDHPNDSGNGYNSATNRYLSSNLALQRSVELNNGPFPSYYFFENDANPAYVHVVAETSTGIFRHFGAGELEKFNDWTGGEYLHAQSYATTTGAGNTASNQNNTILLDGLFNLTAANSSKKAATIHATGLPGQGGAEKWLQCSVATSFANEANWRDSAGNTKRIANCGFRAGVSGFILGNFKANAATGYIPLYSIGVFLKDFTNSFSYRLGSMPDVRGIHLFEFAEKEEITVGSDIWVVFPVARRTIADVASRSYFQGIAYKKVTA